MTISRTTRIVLRCLTVLILGVIYVPLALVLVNSFNVNKTFAWPPRDFTLEWWKRAAESQGALDALWVSVRVGLAATAIALVLGTMIAFALQRFKFYGRDAVSLLVILPIALPGIVTGIALNTAFRAIGLELGMLTIIVGHATFCIVVIYNNVIARLRRTSRSIEEASADLGADTFATFRRVTIPAIRTALVAGALLAFALSFDEIIVTNFTSGAGTQTLPLWIFSNFQRPNQLPLVNVAAVLVLLLSIVPVYLASRLTADPAAVAGART
jgi:putative spermidine/putrescine transport system permease protein